MINHPLIGIVGPFSGPRACYGDLLTQTINNTLLPNYAELIFADDKANPIQAESVAISLVQKNVIGVIGHFNSQSAAAGGKIYASAEIPLLLPASTLPELTTLSTTFRLCADDSEQALAIVRFISKQNFRCAGIWVDGSAYSLSICEWIKKHSSINWIDAKDVSENDLLILLGAHHHVLDYILYRKKELENVTIICCDDCSIEEFIKAAQFFKKMWITTPTPEFMKCIMEAAGLVVQYLQMGIKINFLNWLHKETCFVNQQNKFASFDLIKTPSKI